jgi:hypothetical protein
MGMITVEDVTSSHDGVGESFSITVPPSCTLRELIRCRVRDEVARHKASSSAKYRGLICPPGATPTSDGFVLDEGWQRIEWEAQADKAEHAFTRNGFFVFVLDDGKADRQLEDLDEMIDMRGDAILRFVKLLPLAGG